MADVYCQSWARAAVNTPKETPMCDTWVSLTHPFTHCSLVWAQGELRLLGPPRWQGTCLGTSGNYL